MYQNLIKYAHKIQGASIKKMESYAGYVLIALDDGRFGILSAAIAEEDNFYEHEVKFLKPGEAHALLISDGYARMFFKENGCHDMDAIEREVAQKQKQEELEREQKTIEREKKLLAELKAKYE